MYNIDYVGEENVRKLTKEVVNLLYERANTAEAEEAQTEEEIEEEEEEENENSNV